MLVPVAILGAEKKHNFEGIVPGTYPENEVGFRLSKSGGSVVSHRFFRGTICPLPWLPARVGTMAHTAHWIQSASRSMG